MHRSIGQKMRAASVMDGRHRMRPTYTCAHGWEMEQGDRRNKRGRMQSGVQWWRGLWHDGTDL